MHIWRICEDWRDGETPPAGIHAISRKRRNRAAYLVRSGILTLPQASLEISDMGRISKITAPTLCFTGQLHQLPDAPEAYGAMITHPMTAPVPSPYSRWRF
jgi:hypothetical protein